MKSTVIEHLENFNKDFNIRIFSENFTDVDIEKNGLDSFYERVIYALIKSNPLLAKKHFDLKKLAQDPRMQEESRMSYFLISMVILWTQYKQIYKFDEDTLNAVINSTYKDLTYDELKALRLPYDCFAIENVFEYNAKGERAGIIDTVLVHKQYNEDNGNLVLSIYPFYQGKTTKTIRYDIILERGGGKTVFEWFSENLAEEGDGGTLLKQVINLILYISQPKADVIKKKSNVGKGGSCHKVTPSPFPKSFYSIPYEENEIGLKLGHVLRENKARVVYERGQGEGNSSSPHHTPKSPHIRCGHFHHFWVGKGRQELIVKFVEPTFIAGGGVSKNVTLRKVK